MKKNTKDFLRAFLPRAVRPYRIRSGFLKGRVIYTSLHDYPAAILGKTEAELLNWLAGHVKNGETWIDIGAHYGYTALALSILAGPEGRVYAFEPMITTAGYLNLTRKANGLEQLAVIPLGLGSAGAPALLRLPSTRGMADATVKNAGEHETVLMASLDHLWENILTGSERAAGVKIDVQGMELEVLKGMQTFLKNHRPKIVLEFHTGVDRAEVVSVLESCGYRLPGLTLASGEPVAGLSYLDDRTYYFMADGRA